LTFLFTYPGTPCLFYGDEIGLSGRLDPECRQPFPWDEEKWNHDLRNFIKKLISLRNSHKALRTGTYTGLWSADGVYAFKRGLEDEIFLVALNSSENASTISIEGLGSSARTSKILFGHAEFKINGANIQMTIPPRSGVVIQI